MSETKTVDELAADLMACRLEEREAEEQYRTAFAAHNEVHDRMALANEAFANAQARKNQARTALLAAHLGITIEEAARL